MSKRNRNSNVAVSESATAVIDQPLNDLIETVNESETAQEAALEVIAPVEAAPEVSDETPAAAPFTQAAVRDVMLYGAGTETSFLMSMLLAGVHTKDAIKTAFLAKFCGDDQEQIKRKKTTFSVFFSDVKRPIGVYHASRGLTIATSDEGVLSVTPDSLAAATKAIEGGILTELKGINPKTKYTKYAAVLAKHGLVAEPKK